MSSRTICASCLRSLHQRVRKTTRQPSASLSFISRQQSLLYGPKRQTLTIPRRYASASTYTSSDAPQAEPHQEMSSENEDPAQAKKREDDVFRNYDAINSTEFLFKECASQADYIVPQAFERKGKIPKTAAGEDIGEGSGWWYENLKLTPMFNTWAQVTFIHMYLLTVRFRYFSPERSQMWQQHLHDHFFWECEHRMNIFHGMTSRSIRNRNLKEVYNQWRGVLGAYDEGLMRGDAVLGTAVWRNIFKADEQVDWRDVALITSFIRRGLRALDRVPDKILASASVRFGTPLSEKAVVLKPSLGISKTFTKEDEDELRTLLEN